MSVTAHILRYQSAAVAALLALPLLGCAPSPPREVGVRCADVLWDPETIHRVCSKDQRIEVTAIKGDNTARSQSLLPRSAAIAAELGKNPKP